MNQINELPEENHAGSEFDYSIWRPDSVITLANVNWDSSQEHVIAPNFDLDKFIDADPNSVKITKLGHLKPLKPIRIEMSHTKAMNYNYLRAYNPAQPIPTGDVPNTYYYFVLNVMYVAPGTTELILELDVYATYRKSFTIGRAMVERSHVSVSNKNRFKNYGRDYLSIPEGLDVGSEYIVADMKREEVMSGSHSTEAGHDVMVVSTTDLTADPGTVVAPKISSSNPTRIAGVASGAGVFIFKGGEQNQNQGKLTFVDFITKLKSFPWIGQGIVSATLIPQYSRYYPNFTYHSDKPSAPVSGTQTAKRYDMFAGWRDSERVKTFTPERYRHLDKLKTSPYMMIELTSYVGSNLLLKPESWGGDNATIVERINYLPPSQRVEFHPANYNGTSETHSEGEEHTLAITNFPSVPVVNNGANLALANSANSFAAARAGNDWAYAKASSGANLGFDNAMTGLNASVAQDVIGMTADASMTSIDQSTADKTLVTNAIMDIGGGLAGGGMTGGGKGAALGLAGGVTKTIGSYMNHGIMTGDRSARLGVRMGSGIESSNVAYGAGSTVAGRNRDFAAYAATGDNMQANLALNAARQDLQMTPPSAVGQFGGDALQMTQVARGLTLTMLVKIIDAQAMRRVGELWLRYGYATEAFMRPPANLMTMTNFTYWKMQDVQLINTRIPEFFKQVIRGIFTKGVTVWSDPTKIGVIDTADNAPIEREYY